MPDLVPIRVSRETRKMLAELKRYKEKGGLETYDEVLRRLIARIKKEGGG